MKKRGGARWRVGKKLRRTLYIGDRLVGLVDTPEIAAAIVRAMNCEPAGLPMRSQHNG